jgi:hypothetical protein
MASVTMSTMNASKVEAVKDSCYQPPVAWSGQRKTEISDYGLQNVSAAYHLRQGDV